MRHFWLLVMVCLGTCLSQLSCVNPADLLLRGTLDVVVIDGTLTNLAESQVIQLNRSKADPLTGLPGSVPLTKAIVEVVVDSSEVVTAHETLDGRYQLPSDFKGQIGHAYQLRVTLPGGTHYESTQQVMPAAPPITTVKAQFNPTSLPSSQIGGYTAAHELSIDTQDPLSQANFYRWDWKLWEKQEWCRTCVQGQYSINNVQTLFSANGLPYYQTGDSLVEDCFYPPPVIQGYTPIPYFVYDYTCRTQCWAILYSHQLNVFADTYSNGGMISNRQVAQIPFYQHTPCLVEIRQSALTPVAYRFYKQFQEQTQSNGGVADSPPSAIVGNIQNVANPQESVVGFFTASAVSTNRYWLDRKDTQGIPPGLFVALNGREPIPEPSFPSAPVITIITTIANKPPYTAVCSPTDSRTPVKPVGWRD
ncbi:DUF4249 domain-containing protein [Spirosoma pollinicola]|uniref:DUF4249 domain-containing protein n=1 Tax=Spirosoma pollinicola TaxID=2057025 RepID=A0A2K8ZC46_9BACT|nr:DUF4249 domain-containing protein [Spirosoma pollinicola]AUD07414.1 DUF4249 domain-containing protein [Spirosoma pollinicola]